MKGKSYNYNDETVTTIVRDMWCNVSGKIKENVNSNNVIPLDYIPVNSRTITANEKKEWGIENDHFHLSYEIGDHLLVAFSWDMLFKKVKSNAV